ncbi:MAG: hypothetical protein U9O87_07520 [Verrucomicrobiota bacterium]|nr:hypothetical protein [Verrucomicrobiota bacterium]
MRKNNLDASRAYLSGPMDFVGSRIIEKYLGWRAIVTPIIKALGISVLDPWNKPHVRGHENYGQEGVVHSKSEYEKDFWISEETRKRFDMDFRETVHVDLRMTDMADFLLAFVPTNIYSVGTAHEIVVSRGQHKPVLLISPPIKYDFFPELDKLSPQAKEALKFYGLKENPNGIPSQWWGFIVGGNNIFDGFGWEALDFKSSSFYPELFRTVIANSKPDNPDKLKIWEDVKNWTENYAPLQNLNGGVLDHIRFESKEEEQMLQKDLEIPSEKERHYFWYNHPYTPKRSVLYKILSIASGHIPPQLNFVRKIDKNGNAMYESYESIDDDWMLIYAEND